MLQTTVTLTAAQLKTLHSTPVEIIPAPGPNRVICLMFALVSYRFGTAAFAGLGNLMALVGPVANNDGFEVLDAASIAAAASTDAFFSGAGGVIEQEAPPTLQNVAAFLFAAGADSAVGDGTLTINTFYSIASVP